MTLFPYTTLFRSVLFGADLVTKAVFSKKTFIPFMNRILEIWPIGVCLMFLSHWIRFNMKIIL
jgi:hypothetical protein